MLIQILNENMVILYDSFVKSMFPHAPTCTSHPLCYTKNMIAPAKPLRIPESMRVAEIGPYLRSVREHFTLTLQDVSERLHIRVRYITAMEEGRFELMPGKAYARGYVHTYAEFLGLDPDQVVDQCFQAAPNDTTTAPAEPVYLPRPPSATPKEGKRLGWFLWPAIGIALVIFAFTQLDTDDAPEQTPVVPTEKPVAPVTPEALLAPMYDTVMPTARNYECLGDGLYLSCFFADRGV